MMGEIGPSNRFEAFMTISDKDKLVTVPEVEQGLRFGHLLMSINRHVSREAAAYAEALAALLLEKGLIAEEEFEGKLASVRQAMKTDPQVMLSKAEDKYSGEGEVIIDCVSRLHLCRAACCTFRFYLGPQDLDEGIVKWDYGNPYWVRQRDNKYCYHSNPDSLLCQIHENRPYVCRVYDCRKDKRVWTDFEQGIINPELASP